MAEAAVAIVRTREEAETILLIRRAEREGDSWSGQWSFPGGRRDLEDRDLLETALRELEEECGIRLAREQMVTALPHVVARRQAPPFVTVAPFVFAVDCQLPTVLDAREAAAAAWISVDWLRDPAAHRLRSVPGRPENLLFPAVDLSGAPLWGFTYRLVTAWLGLEPGCRPRERAGAESAGTVLEFLLANGVTLEHGWRDRVAAVKGVIPVGQVLAWFSTPAGYLPGVNCLEVQADQIRLAGLEWEEYWIRAE